MGLEKTTLLHRTIVSSDASKGVIAIKGPVPGPNGAHVYLTLESNA
jgi:ribosomal protein L3